MIALKPIVERLEEFGLRNVAGVVEFAGLKKSPARLPAFYVVPLTESAGKNQLIGAVHQRVAHSFQVVAVLEAAARQTERISEKLKEHCNTIDDALLGWKHPDAKGECLFDGGRLLATDGNVLAWAERYSFPYHKRKVS